MFNTDFSFYFVCLKGEVYGPTFDCFVFFWFVDPPTYFWPKRQNDFFLKWPYKAATEVHSSRTESVDLTVSFIFLMMPDIGQKLVLEDTFDDMGTIRGPYGAIWGPELVFCWRILAPIAFHIMMCTFPACDLVAARPAKRDHLPEA